MNKDQRLLEEAYKAIYESLKEPLYFGPSERKQEFLNWLKRLNHEVHEDGSVTTHESVRLYSQNLRVLPFKFIKVDGDFSCAGNLLGSLEGAPISVTGFFYCSLNRLDTLKGAPEYVGGSFRCNGNMIASLEGAPKHVGEDFQCMDNLLVNLKGAPKFIGGDFICTDNDIKSLEGAQKEIKGEFKSDKFTDRDYRNFITKRDVVDKNLSKDLDVDLGDFS